MRNQSEGLLWIYRCCRVRVGQMANLVFLCSELLSLTLSPMAGKTPGPFPNCDWRFNEFPNPAAHALHVTCVELMALAVPGKDVGNALLNVVLKRFFLFSFLGIFIEQLRFFF